MNAEVKVRELARGILGEILPHEWDALAPYVEELRVLFAKRDELAEQRPTETEAIVRLRAVQAAVTKEEIDIEKDIVADATALSRDRQMTLGKFLRHVREREGISLADAARDARINYWHLLDIEKERTGLYSSGPTHFSLVRDIANVIGVKESEWPLLAVLAGPKFVTVERLRLAAKALENMRPD